MSGSHTRGTLRVTILGCGSSGGVPRADGAWGDCDPADPRNRRTRCGLMLQRWVGAAGDPAFATTVLIDTAPELRQQTAATGARRLDAVVFSHDHADQTHGLDDLRAFAITMRRQIPVFMDGATRATLRRRFDYCFDSKPGYPAILNDSGDLRHGRPLIIEGPGGSISLTPLTQDHGLGPSLGFRFGMAAYSNDVVELPEESFAHLEGLGLWIVDALRYRPHPTHAHVDKALEWIERVRPTRAILTNLHIDLDYSTLAAALPPGVEPAYDGLTIDLSD